MKESIRQVQATRMNKTGRYTSVVVRKKLVSLEQMLRHGPRSWKTRTVKIEKIARLYAMCNLRVEIKMRETIEEEDVE